MPPKRLIMRFEISAFLMEAVEANCTPGFSKSDLGRAALTQYLNQGPRERTESATPERTKKAEIYLQPSEREDFIAYAKELGYSSWQKMALALMRERVYDKAGFPPLLAREAAQTNVHLAAIGKSLSQIARKMHPPENATSGQVDLAGIGELIIKIDAYLDRASEMLRVTIKR